MNMGRGLGESGQDVRNRIMFMARRKRKFGILTNGPLHIFGLFSRIVEQVIDGIFGRHGNGHRRQLEFPKDLSSVFIWQFMALRKAFSSLSSGPYTDEKYSFSRPTAGEMA